MTYVLCYFKDAEDLPLSPAKRLLLPHRQIGNKPSGAAFECEPEKIGLLGRHNRNGFFVQSSSKRIAKVALGADQFLIRTVVGEYLIQIVDVHVLHRQSVDSVSYDLVEPFILAFAAKADSPLGDECGQGELEKNLVIEVFGDKERVLFAFSQQNGLCFLRDKPGQNNGANQDHHQT